MRTDPKLDEQPESNFKPGSSQCLSFHFYFYFFINTWNKDPFRHSSVNNLLNTVLHSVVNTPRKHIYLKILVTKAYQFPTEFLQHIMVRCRKITLKNALQGFMFVVAVTADTQGGPAMANMQ